ncbi:MAG TPA: protein kinase [Planctomycetota bacterium]|nr:protein kinase [Planctomycetota bacterium]
MSDTPTTDPHFADMLDELLDQLLDGAQPDLAAMAERHPRAAHRIDEAIGLASSLAGRKVVSRPSLQGYEIVRELGRGGMGTVYLAKQASLAREVALKVLPHSFGLSAASRQRFLEEARALAHVKHEHIVDIHRIVDDGELLAFEMEFVDGPSLHTVLEALRAHRKTTGAPATLHQIAEVTGLPVSQLGARNLTQFFVRLLLKVARALAAVHAVGFVHRDVKPANLLLRRNGEPVVVDFGLVRARGIEASHAGNFAGTPVYSSPEQLRGDNLVGPASDVYSLAVTLYECLTLVTPFPGRTTTDLLQRIEQGSFPPLRRLAPDAPRDLQTIVAHAMEVDPEQRYRHAGAFADDLQRLLELQPILAKPIHPVRRLAKFVRRNQRTLLAAGAGAILVAAAVIPILHRVEAAGRAREVANEHVRMARQRLISIESGDIDWRHSVWGNMARPQLEAATAQTAPLRGALVEYDAALDLVPADPTTRRERDVVRVAIWLRQLTVSQADTLGRALDGQEFADLTAHLGPATVATARMLAGDRDQTDLAADIAAADDDDRTSAGTLAFLFGEFRLCEQAWATLQPDLADQPLVDAGLGRLLLADGVPEAAYVRLLQAQRHFPASATLALELADTALRLGDLRLAQQWLARLPDTPEIALSRRRVELDLRAAAEPGADLAPAYEALAAANPHDPTARHRLAQLAMRRGDLAEAEARLEHLLRNWPDAARFRLDRARIALQRRDLAAYARQVLAVLARDHGRGRSRGTCADLLEILRIGGLERLYLEGLAATGKERTGRTFVGGEMPIEGFAARALTRDFEDLVEFVRGIRWQTAALKGGEQWLDDLATQAFVAVPLALAQLPVAGLPTPAQRALLSTAPWLERIAYPLGASVVRRVLATLHLSGWTLVDLGFVERPDDLPGAACFGSALVRVDDETGDGISEVLVACMSPRPVDGQGRVLLVDGKTAQVLATVETDSDEHVFGHSVAVIDDLDGDGHRDWLIGAPSGSQGERRGRAELWSGRTRQLLARLEGDEPGFGVGVAGLGDCDGDGCPDFAVATAPLLRNSAAQGSVQVFSGRTRQVLYTLRNDVAGVWYGACIANAGDCDGDGVPDLIVGGNFGAAPGLARLYSGRSGAVLQTWTDPSLSSGFGTLVGSAGDLDGDGRDDVVVTALRHDDHSGVDQIFLYSGATGSALAVFSGPRVGCGFGTAVLPYPGGKRTLGLVIGVPYGGDPVTGVVEFWSVNGRQAGSVTGPRVMSRFGATIALTNDDDGDGLPELFVGGPADNDEGVVARVGSSQLRLGALRR